MDWRTKDTCDMKEERSQGQGEGGSEGAGREWPQHILFENTTISNTLHIRNKIKLSFLLVICSSKAFNGNSVLSC